MISVNKTILPDKVKIDELFSTIIANNIITNNGPFVKKFEHALKLKLGCENLLTVCNGTIALQLAIHALGKKGEIITSPFTCSATSSAIVWEGCKPVYCDIDPDTYCIDSDKIEEFITEKTVAILGVHVFGNLCNVEKIQNIADKYGIAVIYDGAHAFGSTYKNISAFQFGDFSTVSFHAYKIVSTIEGGAVFCKNTEFLDLIFKLRFFGKNIDNIEVVVGTNAKMNEFSAAYGLLSLEQFDGELANRTSIAEYYKSLFSEVSSLKLQKINPEVKSNHSYFPLVLPTSKIRDMVLDEGLKDGIEYRKYFSSSLNTLHFFGNKIQTMPHSEEIASRIICLPINSSLKEADIEKISKGILRFFK